MLSISLIGCGHEVNNENNNTATENDESIHNVIISSKPTNNRPKFLWEKESEELDITSLKIGANWFEEIAIGKTKISSTAMTDISSLPNYFFTAKDDPSKIEAAYYDPHYAIKIGTKKIQLGQNSSCSMQIDSTTYKNNLMIESVQITGITNVLEDNGMELKGLSSAIGSLEFGFGSTYNHVLKLIGKPETTVTDDSGDFNIATAFYNNQNASMTLVFSYPKDGKIEDGVLTSIYWKPLEVCSILHSQPNIYTFKGAPDISQPEDEMTENTNGAN
jgi:hypothetical protein